MAMAVDVPHAYTRLIPVGSDVAPASVGVARTVGPAERSHAAKSSVAVIARAIIIITFLDMFSSRKYSA
jgi:hypothetical protein